MPFVFIHGVNTRETDEDYETNLNARNKLVLERLLDPLAAKDDRLAGVSIHNPYWGMHGVEFRWGMESLPDVRILEHFGDEDADITEADLEFCYTVRELATASAGAMASDLEGYGVEEGTIRAAAEANLVRFVEALLYPMLLSETRIAHGGAADPATEGLLQALVAMASEDVARDPEVAEEVSLAGSDDEVVDLITARVRARLEHLAAAELDPPEEQAAEVDLEPYGSDWVGGFTDRVVEMFSRMKDAPQRLASVSALDLYRERLHRRFSRFLGDVFVYLDKRGDQGSPGPIVSTVLDGIKDAIAPLPGEPLIVVTHSMGGNILYDILTYYAQDLHVDVWISVGGQVGLFEEMKLFKASDEAIGKPNRVAGLKPRVGYWLNVYDPADNLSFKAKPVFADVEDLEYLTGASALKAHGAYFGRASFYSMLKEKIAQALASKSIP